MKYFLSAGEASGDLHGSHLITAIKAIDPKARFVVMGGPLMAAAAGVKPILDYRDSAVMGFTEVLRKSRTLLHNIDLGKHALEIAKPDVFIPIDFPGFNLKLAAHAHKLGIPNAYYISPKLWAWKEWRGRAIRKTIDLMLCILPFEPEYYLEQHAYSRALYVGNPSVEEMRRHINELPDADTFRAHNLPGVPSHRPLIALVPGSRRAEIASNLPVMIQAATIPGHTAVIAGAPGIPESLYRSVAPDVPVVHNATAALMRHSAAALVTSGTATLECALLDTPQVVCYRSNGMRIAYHIMRHVISVDHVSLPNLIAGHTVVPEMLVHECTPAAVRRELLRILPGTTGAEAQHAGYRTVADHLGGDGAADRAARAIHNLLTKRD